MTHRIRLRGPWQRQPLDRPPTEAEARPPRPAQVLYTRFFNRPTGLHAAQSVELVVDKVQPHAAVHLVVRLNDEVLGELSAADAPLRWSVGPQLQPRNKLELLADLPPPIRTDSLTSGGGAVGAEPNQPAGRPQLPGDVRLEIHEPGEGAQRT